MVFISNSISTFEETVEQLVGVVDPLGVLADDPDHARPRFRLVQRVQILAKSADDALVLVRVLSETKKKRKLTCVSPECFRRFMTSFTRATSSGS